MRIWKKWLTVVLTTVFAVFMTVVSAFALTGSGGLPGDGTPPNGLAISSDAPGIKLTGVLVIEYINLNADDFADSAKVLLRLRKGNDLFTFYDEIPGPLNPQEDPLGTQMAIMGQMSAAVLGAFFPGQSGLEAKVKSLVNWDNAIGGPWLSRDSILPGYGTCHVETVCKYDSDPKNIDPDGEDPRCNDPDNWFEILTCDGSHELCGNSIDPEQMPIDDDGDWRPDIHGGYLPIRDPDCFLNSFYSISDIDLSVK